MLICPKCKAEASKFVDKTPGAAVCRYECKCERPTFPLIHKEAK